MNAGVGPTRLTPVFVFALLRIVWDGVSIRPIRSQTEGAPVMCNKTQPTPEDLLRLHAQLIAGGPSAGARLCEAVFDELIARVCRDHARIDEHLCQEAAGDALLSLLRRPDSFDPELAPGGLMGFLRRAARCDLFNRLRREQRHRIGRDPLPVEDSPEAGKYLGSEDDEPSHVLSLAEQRPWTERPAIRAVLAALTPEERIVFDLMCQGERRTSVLAAAIGRGEQPPAEQQHDIKQIRDRIIKRLERAGGGRERSA